MKKEAREGESASGAGLRTEEDPSSQEDGLWWGGGGGVAVGGRAGRAQGERDCDRPQLHAESLMERLESEISRMPRKAIAT
jgi:hypothetical protein